MSDILAATIKQIVKEFNKELDEENKKVADYIESRRQIFGELPITNKRVVCQQTLDNLNKIKSPELPNTSNMRHILD